MVKKLIISICTYNSSNSRHKLKHFYNINVIAVFLLKSFPIKLKKFLFFFFPVFYYFEQLRSMVVAAKGKMKNIQHINSFFFFFKRKTADISFFSGEIGPNKRGFHHFFYAFSHNLMEFSRDFFIYFKL